jgi:hypothetical protein
VTAGDGFCAGSDRGGQRQAWLREREELLGLLREAEAGLHHPGPADRLVLASIEATRARLRKVERRLAEEAEGDEP